MMNDSHASLRDDFELSSTKLDIMVHLAVASGNALGARMTGGGFNGCTINLTNSGDHTKFINNISASHSRETGMVPEVL